jgi:hypothetical protein
LAKRETDENKAMAGEVAGKFRRYRCDACRIISLKRRSNHDECDKNKGNYDTGHDVRKAHRERS